MNSLYGLVVCGGKSSRMSSDKSLLHYHDKAQRYHLYEIMQSLCERVFISCNKYQKADIPSEYEVLVDEPEYENIGPMAALLTAFKHFPDINFMMIGCDYPLIDRQHLELLSKLNQTTQARSYFNIDNQVYEPLLCVYHSSLKSKLEYCFKNGTYSLQKILRKLSAEIIIPDDILIIKSIDTIDEYKKTLKQLSAI
jgi:molybdopterin-guanine dinucleotide biosynthesis protein A